MKITHKIIATQIRETLEIWIRRYSTPDTAEQMNHGWCGMFALEVLEALEIDNHLELHYKDELPEDLLVILHTDKRASLEDEYQKPGLLPSHWWLYYNGYHYDVECPEGTPFLEYLPVFERSTEVTAEDN